MRIRFNETIGKLARLNPAVCLVVGDVSPIAFPAFAKESPEKFINVGIAESNMVGMAAGLALSGKIPFLYTIGTFMTMRCYEQIRDDLCYQNLNVNIVGVGSGVVYSTLGGTHHSTEDIAILRALPNMTILSPADPQEAEKAAVAAAEIPGPVYIRLGKAGEPNLHQPDFEFKVGKANYLRQGNDITFISTGIIQRYVLAAAERLATEGIQATVMNMHTLKPIDREAVKEAANRGPIITVEEHQIIGGLGSAVGEVLAEEAVAVPFRRLGLQDTFAHNYGKWEDLLKELGLSADHIVCAAKELMR